MTTEEINRLIGVEEAYKASQKLMQIMGDTDARENLFKAFLARNTPLCEDFFLDYFQTEHGDRDRLKQDYTPHAVAEIAAGVFDKAERIADICAGTGNLTIHLWGRFPDAFYRCEEFAERALPFLLFNLAIRNMRGEVLRTNVVTREVFEVYRLEKGAEFSTIEKGEPSSEKFDAVITNPPYSLPWTPVKDERTERYGMPPSSKADFLFILHGLRLLKEGGTLSGILPHGVLFRGQREGVIRTGLLKNKLFKAVIGIPNACFLNTTIPVAVLVLKKSEDPSGVYFIDASKHFEKIGKQAFMKPEHVGKVLDAFRLRANIERFASLASAETIADNDFNLNIPRYVDTSEPEEEIDIGQVLEELADLETKIDANTQDFCGMFRQLKGLTIEQHEAFKKWEKLALGNSRKSQKSKERSPENGIQPELF